MGRETIAFGARWPGSSSGWTCSCSVRSGADRPGAIVGTTVGTLGIVGLVAVTEPRSAGHD